MNLKAILVVASFLICISNLAQGSVRVVKTMGDTKEAVCLATSSQHLWVGTSGAGVLRMDSTATTRFDARRGLSGNRVQDCCWHDGALFVATAAGLSKFDEQTQSFTTISHQRFVKIASAGNRLIAATDNGVFSLFEPTGSRTVSIDISPISLFGSDDGVWVAGDTKGRIYRSDKKGFMQARGPVLSLSMTHGDVYASTPYGGFVETNDRMSIDKRVGNVFYTAAGKAVALLSLFNNSWVHGVSYFDGIPYAATADGLWKRPAGRWALVKTPTVPCGDRIASLATFDGALWVGSFDRGLCRLKGDTWTHFSGPEHLASDMVNDMVADDEHLWVATRSGLTVVDTKLNFEVMTHEMCIDNRKADCPWHAAVNGVSKDPKTGQIWVADVGAVHRVQETRWKRFYKKLGLKTRSISRIASFDGKVAVGTTHQGVLWGGQKGGFATLGDNAGLADNWVMDLSFDDSGVLWVATCTKGISRFDGEMWRSWTVLDGLVDNYTLSVKEIDGKIWIGTLSGLSILGDKQITNITAHDGLSGNEVHDILEHNGYIYLATDGGLTVLSVD